MVSLQGVDPWLLFMFRRDNTCFKHSYNGFYICWNILTKNYPDSIITYDGNHIHLYLII